MQADILIILGNQSHNQHWAFLSSSWSRHQHAFRNYRNPWFYHGWRRAESSNGEICNTMKVRCCMLTMVQSLYYFHMSPEDVRYSVRYGRRCGWEMNNIPSELNTPVPKNEWTGLLNLSPTQLCQWSWWWVDTVKPLPTFHIIWKIGSKDCLEKQIRIRAHLWHEILGHTLMFSGS